MFRGIITAFAMSLVGAVLTAQTATPLPNPTGQTTQPTTPGSTVPGTPVPYAGSVFFRRIGRWRSMERRRRAR